MSGAGQWFEDRITINTPEGVELHVVVAGIGSRFVARLLDSLIQGSIMIALALIAAAASLTDSGIGTAILFIALFLVVFVYDTFFELTAGGATPGKRATGLRVVTTEGAPVGVSASLIRNVVRIVDFLPIFYAIGVVSMLATEHTQRLGDLAAGTYVERERLGDHRDVAMQDAAVITVRPEQVADWDVSAITGEELAVVRAFLARRLSLPADTRYTTAAELALRLAKKASGLPRTSHPEFVLEGIVLAKEMRS